MQKILAIVVLIVLAAALAGCVTGDNEKQKPITGVLSSENEYVHGVWRVQTGVPAGDVLQVEALPLNATEWIVPQHYAEANVVWLYEGVGQITMDTHYRIIVRIR